MNEETKEIIIDQHTVIVGVTGAGKTYASQRFIKEAVTPFTMFWNTQDEFEAKSLADIVVESPEELLEVFREYQSANICYQCSENIEEAKQELEIIKNILFTIGKQVNNRIKIKKWITFYVDEVTDYSSKNQPDAAINMLYRRGRRHGIIMVALTQRPALTSHTILTQSTLHIYFIVEDMERPYFKKYFGDAFDTLWSNMEKKHHFVCKSEGHYYKHKPL